MSTASKIMIHEAATSLRALAVVLVLCCGAYPLVVFGLGQAFFPWQANGSLIDREGRRASPANAAGSRILGQPFIGARYFHPRPSAAGSGYDAANSSGTNLGPLSDKLLNGAADDPATKDVDESFAGIKDLTRAYREENGLAEGARVPADAVTRSASGLDPHISVANADIQVARVARARGLSAARVHALVEANTEPRGWGVFGDPGVNVTMLNIALDEAPR